VALSQNDLDILEQYIEELQANPIYKGKNHVIRKKVGDKARAWSNPTFDSDQLEELLRKYGL
jgi:hypothetical protein